MSGPASLPRHAAAAGLPAAGDRDGDDREDRFRPGRPSAFAACQFTLSFGSDTKPMRVNPTRAAAAITPAMTWYCVVRSARRCSSGCGLCAAAPARRALSPGPAHGFAVPPRLARGVDRERHVIGPRESGLARRFGQVDFYRVGEQRRGNHENHQQHEHHVDQRDHVDLRQRRALAAFAEATERHGSVPPRGSGGSQWHHCGRFLNRRADVRAGG